MDNRKVFLLGLDGATFNLILPWVSDGELPAFSKFISEGVYSELESVPNQRSAAAWTSFMTGKNPGKHGIFEFYEYLPSTYNLRFINGKARDGDSLWKILSNNGKNVGIINVPMTYPAEDVNGFLIAGLDSPSVKSRNFTYPEDLYNTLQEKFGDYILEPGLTGAIVGGRIEDAIELIKVELTQKMDISRYLMSTYPWDFFTVVLRSLDAVQHCFWKYMDISHPHYNVSESRKYEKTILNTYKMIDRFLAELMEILDEDTNFIIMSDHGFGQKHPATNQLNQWLESKGYLAYNKSPQSGSSGLLGKLYRGVVGRTPRKTKEWLWETFPSLRDKVQTRLCFANMDWSNTLAYSDSLFPNVRINLTGRELHGTVKSKKEYEDLIKKLVTELKELRDINTGEKIVKDVFRREEIYHGKYVNNTPDLLLRWREDITISGISIEQSTETKPTTPFIPGEDYRVISGDHQLNGIFMARGKGIKDGIKLDKANIMDIAPTVLYQMGVSIPDEMDGSVLSSIFCESFLDSNTVAYKHNNLDGAESRDFAEYTEEEEKELENRLRGLGYIE
ncbi:hypothetical protein SCALIN_C11_0035 [Candidatus Scalindua japonica]|uniref:Type I phosphodiesterase/nucleotide pyrophosphatase n=1 Tax=Candidatus Scalindua japonica TaxID=1284222 RepID=A0A286TX11_9BACT|nr:alkaline phosphatase family protein [Candidatus Scalindua japonica]GAX60424.1 hypothetical protein SCALIN_C11_0035 [Candidatus Scalindua japonica]